MKKMNRILWGIVLIAIGAVLALKVCGVEVDIFIEGWWTFFIIIPSAIGLFTEREKLGNLIGILIGVLLLLAARDVITFGFAWKLMVPAIIILVGLKLVFGAFFHKKGEDVYRKRTESGKPLKNGTAVFGGTEMRFDGEVFDGAELNAVFGGVNCDLRGAEITGDCVINACAVFGGIDIFVPDGINVKIDSTSIFGGASDEKKRPFQADRPTVYIRATALFGGVDAK